jgi:hypothetical protein
MTDRLTNAAGSAGPGPQAGPPTHKKTICVAHCARVAVASLLGAALILPSPVALACGPFFETPIFTEATGPEIRDEYIRGRLGLLQPTYWHEPLYISYRNLSGKPFTPDERNALTQPSEEQSAAAKDWVKIWREKRAEVLDKGPEVQMYNNGYGIARQVSRADTYFEYYNCLNGAFERATQTLNDRAKQFGSQSPIVKDWITAQDQVFENCAGAPGYPPKLKPAVIPAVAHPSDPEVIRADRDYQIAAAHFYAGNYDAAEADFETIAKDPSSPYRRLAPYLVARTMIRKSTLAPPEDKNTRQTLAQAETQLRAIIADANLADMHDPAQRLLGFVLIRLHPRERFRELETSLGSPGNSKNFRQDLTDYLWLLDHEAVAKPATAPMPNEESAITGGDVTDWILTFEQVDQAAYEHSLQRWEETKSLPWLVSALSKAGANDKTTAELNRAAEEIPAASPAYVTVSYHRLRLLAQSGKRDAARRELDQFLAQAASPLDRSARNQFRALRMSLATNLVDFLTYAPRVPAAAITTPDSGDTNLVAKPAPYFDGDAATILTEKLPLQLLAEAAKSNTLPAALRRQVVIAAWTRAILLDDEATALALVPEAQELVPEINDELANYTSGSDASSRQFAAVFALLRNPGFRPFVTAGYPRGELFTVGEPRFNRIDNLRDNWWCAFAPESNNQFYGDYYRMFTKLSSPLQEIYPNGKVNDPAFLTTEDRVTAAKERSVLEPQPAAPNWLGKLTLGWANTHPDDPRVPEALHLVVRARRYGCTDSSAENYSKQAFTLLHKRYADNEWAKKTPYWFE